MNAGLPRLRADGVFYVLVLPFAALTILFGLWPIILSVGVSFTASGSALGSDPRWIGFANYATVLADEQFRDSLIRTLVYTALAVAANLAFALAAAMLLDGPLLRRGNMLFRLALFLPVVTPDVAGYVVWRWLFDQSFGAVNAALDLLSLPRFGGLASLDTATIAILIAELWHHAGFYAVIFLANLAIRDPALEEAARVDGAGAWARFRHVILPQLRPAIVVNLVYATIQFLKTFTVVVVMTKGGPAESTTFVSYLAYQLFDQARYGEATAMATILFVIVIAISLLAYAAGERGRA
ncbi:carbohydrate ABC transporter permease [Roseomonas sp. CCTCC AB2023176]|uniref:carbohydrate ABC transporter permease n=1 Tax=Roseomonas sp. CCTCC AB2023176 TaxID=3342640 RepID=UPI0035DA5796